MKRNGFTLVELTVTIAIILIITLLITPRVTKIINDNRNKGYKEIERRLEEAANKYLNDEYVDSTLDTVTITKEQLINGKYIDEIYDLKDNSVCDAYVTVTNLNTTPSFNAVLTCSSYTK